MNSHRSGCIRQVCSRNSASIWRHRVVSFEQVLEHRHTHAAGMNPLRDVRQLLRIAQHDQVAGARTHRHRIRQRHLARFVDEQIVELPLHLFPGEQPRRAGDNLRVGLFARLVAARRLEALAVVLGLVAA